MQPLRFLPILKRRRWGGERLGTVLGKAIGPEADYAESWELVDHGNDQSIVESACDLKGFTLQSLVRDYSTEVIGPHANHDQFPLLFKFLDANDRLSVQVHPNDEQAKHFDLLENGKTEAWYVIEADPGSVIYTGLKSGIGRNEFEQAIATGNFEDCLHEVHPCPGECYLIPAGTVHALGEGVLIAEIQQSSDLTFRIFDWNRVDRDGQPRELHIEQALSCIDFDSVAIQSTMSETLVDLEHHTAQQLVACDYFRLHSHRIRSAVTFPNDDSCRVVMGISGQGRFVMDSTVIEFQKGETLLIPASCPELLVEPTCDEELVFLETVDFC